MSEGAARPPAEGTPVLGEPQVAVVQVLDSLDVGGKERVAVDLANDLVSFGYESHVLCTRRSGPLEERLGPAVRSAAAGRRSRFDLAGLRRIAGYLDDHSIAIVHTHNHSSSYLMRLALRLVRQRPLHVVHDHQAAIDDRRTALLDRGLLRNVDAWIAVSEPLRDRARRILPHLGERCVYVPNGIEIPERHERPGGPPTVVQVANLRWTKGHPPAMRAAALVRERIPDLRWICVGRIEDPPDEYAARVRALMASLDLADCVELVGEQSDVQPFLRKAHVGVLTSDHEALPLALLEYLATELPVVVTDVGQVLEVVRSCAAGHVVQRGDAEGIAAAVIELLSDTEAARSMGARGHAHVTSHYSRGAVTTRIHALYQDLLRRQRPSAHPGESS